MSPFMDQDQPPEAVGSLHGYITSTNYELLFHLAKRQPVVCEVDFVDAPWDKEEAPQRDICKTRYSAHFREHHIEARGNTYLQANSQEEFTALCKHNNLQWVVPPFLLRGVNSLGDNSLDLGPVLVLQFVLHGPLELLHPARSGTGLGTPWHGDPLRSALGHSSPWENARVTKPERLFV